MNKNIKKIIAREGIILLGIAILYYLFLLFLGSTITSVTPKYKITFIDGQTHTIEITPKFDFSKEGEDSYPKKYIKEWHYPLQKNILDSVEKLIERENIKSEVEKIELINSKKLNISYLLFSFHSLKLFFQIVILYSVYLFIRFIIWAIKILREKR
ncbi:MAG: hypothetical protein KKH29_02850 [Candidatus Omnitrophica bacterium]|nr:hypothetical protein [Candidatus Omnitrophota bacterium]